MKIKWEEWGTIMIRDLEKVIESKSFDQESGVIETIERKIDDIILFNAKVIELLYGKGVLTKKDISTLLKPFIYSEGDIEIIEE